MDTVELTTNQLRHIFLVGTHLHQFQGKSSPVIPDIIKSQGMVQYDPLNPAGRYHDHFLCSRIENYKQGDFERLVYKKKLIFEAYNPNVSAISIEHYPIFKQFAEKEIIHNYYLERINKLNSRKPTMLDEVYNYVVKNGKTTGRDLSHLGKAHKEFASWKSTQTSSSALEYLWLLGKLAIVERTDRFTKVYDVIEKYIPKKYLEKRSDSLEELYLQRFLVQLKSFPVVNIKNITENPPTIHFSKKQLINDIIYKNDLFTIVTVSGTSKQLIVPNNYLDLLNKDPYDDHMRIIGALDPLIWDRDLIKKIFNFDYTWEVYKKEKDRIYGYYVFPLLYKGLFVGRMEMKIDTNNDKKILKIFNLRLEKSTKVTNDFKSSFDNLVNQLQSFSSADTVIKDKTAKI